MANQFILTLEQLKISIGAQDPKSASLAIDAIAQYFDDVVSDSEIDLRIDKVFSEDGGLIGFQKLAIKSNKLFKDENVKIFRLYVKIIESHEKKMPPYAERIVNICHQYISSFHTTAYERENAASAIQQLLQRKLCEHVDKTELMQNLLRALNGKKTSTRLSQKMFELIGLVSKDYPQCLRGSLADQTRIRDIYFKTLEDILLNQCDINFAALIGALNGFRYFLVNFPPSPENEVFFSQRLYTCIKKLSDPPDGARQREVYRCALELLQCHSRLFGEHLLTDYMYWHNLLMTKWMPMPWEDRKTAIMLLHAFHREIAKKLSTSDPATDEAERLPVYRDILKFFIGHFKATLQSAASQPYEIRIAIRGFGLMAEPCKKHLPPEHLTQLLMLVMQRTECLTNAGLADHKDSLEHFPDYVQALSQIMTHVSGLSSVQLVTLRDIIVALIRHFHLLSKAHHAVTVDSLMSTFNNLMRLGDTILDDVLERIVLKGVIWTCSHKLEIDVANDWQDGVDWKEQITYKSYLPLWQGLLTPGDHNSYDRPAIVRKIHDHLMQTLFYLFDKLDLTTQKRVHRDDSGNDLQLHFSDPNYDLVPIRPKDFHIFFNLVEFYRAIFKGQSTESLQENFQKWLKPFVDTVIRQSIKYPLISGYLKLMQTTLKITQRIKYFAEDGEMGDDNDPLYGDIMHYLRGMISKANQTSGELQMTCLTLLFSAPTVMLKDFIIDLVPAFLIAFDFGKSNANIWIASMALSAMERYVRAKHRTSEEVTLFLHDVLPSLDPYLRGVTCEQTENVTTRQKRGAEKLVRVVETEFLKFQRRIILFLGSLEPDRCLQLVRKDDAQLNIVKWSESNNVVSLKLFGPGASLRISLDGLLPRICELACTSTERPKKMAACELVHAILLYVIGTDKHRGKLWKELCGCMLQLGCDGDVAVQQMFEPLIMETMHYMSRTDRMQHEGVHILLQCQMEALAHRTNAAVRDLAARSLREYLVWSIKQTTREQMANSPISIRSLIEKIKLFSLDSVQEKRFAAALAFNNMYRVLREEDAIVSAHWMELFYVFCMNLLMSEEYGERNIHNQPDLKQVVASLDHLVRVFRERKHIFNASTPGRRVPATAFDGDQLRHVVRWLFHQSSSTRMIYRHKVMEMFTKLAICVDNCNASSAFLRLMETRHSVIEMCEGSPTNGKGIAARPSLSHIDKNDQQISRIREWLESVHASLDCYVWLINDGLVADVVELFNEQVAVFEVIGYFLEKVCRASTLDLLALIEPDAMNIGDDDDGLVRGDDDDGLVGGANDTMQDYELGIEEINKISMNKCRILLRIYELIAKLLTMNSQLIPPVLWASAKDLFEIIIDGAFKPQSIGFEAKDVELVTKLSTSTESLIVALYRHAPPEHKTNFNKLLSKQAVDHYHHWSTEAQSILSYGKIENVHSDQLNGIDLMHRLHKTKKIEMGTQVDIYLSLAASKVLYELFDGVREKVGEDYCAVMPKPEAQRLANQLMQISFQKANIYGELIDLLLNVSDLKVRGCDVTIKHGKHFLNLYKTKIFAYLLKGADIVFVVERLVQGMTVQSIQYIFSILIDLVDFAYKRHANDKPQMTMLTNVLLQQWPILLQKASETGTENITSKTVTHQLMLLMTHIAMICPYALAEISGRAAGFESWLLDTIVNGETQMDSKSCAISLLPCIIGPKHREHEAVQRTLKTFQANHFPLYSTEFREGSLERAAYENVFGSILGALNASLSPLLLRFLINCTSADPKHILEYKIAEYVKSFVQGVSADTEQLLCALNIPYSMFANEQHDPSIRLSILRRFQLPMLRDSTIEATVQFYTNHIKEIDKWCGERYSGLTSEWKTQQALTTRICAFELIEVMAGVLPKEVLTSNTCSIGITLLGATKVVSGKEIIGSLSKKAFYTHSEQFSSENPVLVELFRKYQCASYRALCAFTSNTQTELKYYQKFLFEEKPSENRFIWKHLIDTTRDDLYTDLTLEVDRNPKLKERFVSIRRPSESLPTKYLETQNVFDSSLSQDVTKIDLSFSSVRTASADGQAMVQRETCSASKYVLEKNSINDHEVMPTLCAVVEHMFENRITPVDETLESSARRRAPEWIESICATIESDQVHKNIRLFLAALIDTCRHRFRYYARVLTKSILKLMTSQAFSQQLDAFVVFLAVDLLEWHQVYPIETPDEISMASDLIANLMRQAWHERRAVFKKNLELIRCLVEIWSAHMHPPRQFLCDSIRYSNEGKSNKNVCGIQLNAIVLANGVIPWSDTTQTHYLRTLGSCIDNELTGVHQPAAQVLGMALDQIIVKKETLGPADEEFMELLYVRLDELRKRDEKKFCDILYGIHRYYAPIVDKYLTNIASIISHTIGPVKRNGLEMFLARVTSYEDNVYREVVTIKIKTLLQSNEYQLLALHIINKVLPKMNATETGNILPDVCAIANSKYADCRDVMYEIMIFVRKTYSEKALNRQASMVLLNGLNDIDAQLQRNIFTYWSREEQLPAPLQERIVCLFQKMYDPLAERNFVAYCSQLLLEPAIEHEESKHPILQDRNDTDAKFQEYQINTNWRSQNTSLRAPLFTESQQRQIIGGEISTTQNYLRATVDNEALQFDPTIDPSVMQHRSTSFSLQSASSLLFSDAPQTLDRRSERVHADGATATTTSNTKTPYNRLRARILRDTNVVNREQALKAIERKAHRTVMQSQQQKSDAGKVTLYRRYRFGDYPDFLINSLALLLPLQALIRHDMVVARQMMVTIFQAICGAVGPMKGQFLTSIGDCVRDIFAQTKHCDSMLFDALIEMALTDTRLFNIDTNHLVAVSNANNMMANGILLLEDRLNGNIVTGRCGSTSSVDVEANHWIQLAKMYYNLSEYDIVAGVFADKLDTDARLPKAIQYESMSDFANAKDLYMQIIDDRDVDAESDFAYQSLFRCVEKMGDWAGLSRDIGQQVKDVEELWTDEWNRENLLPHYMHAELRLLLNESATNRQFVDNVERWLRSSDRADYIKMNFSEILMMLYIRNSDYLPARIFSENFFDRFLNEWNHISVLSNKMRTNKILEISKIAEIHKYCDLLFATGGHIDRGILEEFEARWENTQMCATDPLHIWESVVAYRQFICNLLPGVIDPNDSVASNASTRVTNSVFDMHFKLSDIALKQNNTELAKRTMAHIKRCIGGDGNGKRSAQWNLLNGKSLVLQSQQVTNAPVRSLELLVDAWQQHVDTLTDHATVLVANPDIFINVMEQFAEIGETVLDTIGKCDAVDAALEQQLITLTQPSTKGPITERIYDHMCDGFRKSIELAEKCETSANRMFSTNFSLKANGIGEMYNRFAMFCQQYYCIEGVESADELQLDVERNILVSVLRGMKYGSKNSRLQFPRILQLRHLVDMQLADEFDKEMQPVPEWMFISWIPQILSRFSFASPCFLDALVIRLAKMYPSAMLFPFKLAHSQHQAKQLGPADTWSRPIVHQIMNLLRNPVAEKFIASIECLNVPEKKLHAHLQRIYMEIRANDQYTNEEYHSQMAHTLETVFENPMRGSIVEKIESFKATVQRLLQLNVVGDRPEINETFEKSLKKLNDMAMGSRLDSVNLDKFAPWLQQFHWLLGDDCIELPGQYTGESRPNIKTNIKIVRFDSNVKVFRTLRRPIKLSILCSDGNTYDFLIKYGEDLRQDQCIQQMQRLINDQLAADKNCHHHNLGIETFNVIPISSFCGMLSWVQDTQSMGQMVGDMDIHRIGIIADFHKFLDKAPNGRSQSTQTYTRYGEAVASYTRQEIAENYAAIASKIPTDVLRDALYAMSSSPECFFMLRNNFASSVATMGISNWTLGIGDRHLSNLLISKKTGKIIGIDFGMAYGMATRDLLIPELIPLRLTPQFVKVVGPMETSGLIKKSMVYTLRAIRAARKTMMAAMAAFMTDQSITVNLNEYDEDSETMASDSPHSNPKHRINVVNRKLMGANPALLIANDLKCGQISKFNAYMNGYVRVLMNNSSAKMNENDLSADDQVNCLIDLATDPAILGISFEGLTPWI